MCPSAHLLNLLLVCLLISPTVAVFADEAYQIDYHYSLLGISQAPSTFFHRPSANSKAALIYTLSDRNVIGAINPKDGSLLWRQRLLDEGQISTSPGFLKAGKGADLVISAVDGVVQAWDAVDGRLAWDSKGEGKLKALEVLANTKFENDVLVAYEVDGTATTRVKRLAAKSGELKQLHEDLSGDIPFALVSTEDASFYLSLHPGILTSYKIHVSQLDLESAGKNAAQPIQLADTEVSSLESLLYAGNNGGLPLLVWTDKSYKVLKFNVIGSKQVTTVNVNLKARESVNKIVVHALGSSAGHAHALVHYQSTDSHWAEVYHIGDFKAVKSYDLPIIEGSGVFSVSRSGSGDFFVRHTSKHMTLYSPQDASVLAQWDTESVHTDPLHATSEVISRGADKYSLRSALALPSGDLELIRNGERLWSRPEGLTGIVAARFVEIVSNDKRLEDLTVESHSSLMAAYIHRLRRHAKELKSLPGWLHSLSVRTLPELLGIIYGSQTDLPLHSGYGFDKVVLVATANGRLAALHASNQGAVLWNIHAMDVPLGETWDVLSIDEEDDSVLVRSLHGASIRVATSSGQILSLEVEDRSSPTKSQFRFIDSHGATQSISVNRDGTLGDVEGLDLTSDVVVVTEDESGLVRGWKLLKDGRKLLGWQFSPDSGQRVQSLQVPPAHDPVASIGKALGDRNVLYKYLNPNIFLLTTIGVNDSTVNFHVIDSISGSIIYAAKYTGIDTSKPISSTLTENWFAYSFFSESAEVSNGPSLEELDRFRGYQLVISEIFESPFPNDRGPLGDSANFSAVGPLPAHGTEIADNPYVISQAFLTPGPISHMTTTSTLQGITPRSLLCTLPQMHALISVPRHVLDPRRPVGRDPSPLEAEEGLFRFSPILDFEPKWLLNHKREILGVSDVISTPSKLESTSLIFAYGDVDVFGTRLSPIGSFDMLGKGFSKPQLIGTVTALAIGTMLLAPFVRKKQVDGLWKA